MACINAALFLVHRHDFEEIWWTIELWKQDTGCNKLELSSKEGGRFWCTWAESTGGALHLMADEEHKHLTRIYSSPCRIFPISSARLFIEPGWPQPWCFRMEAGREPSHQERSDPGEALSGLFMGNLCFYSGKHRQRLTGPLTVCKCSVTSPRLSDMNLTFMMINDKARGRRGVKIQFKSMLIAATRAHTVSSGPHSNEVLGEAYRWINVSMCLMCGLHWPEEKLGVNALQSVNRKTWFKPTHDMSGTDCAPLVCLFVFV